MNMIAAYQQVGALAEYKAPEKERTGEAPPVGYHDSFDMLIDLFEEIEGVDLHIGIVCGVELPSGEQLDVLMPTPISASKRKKNEDSSVYVLSLAAPRIRIHRPCKIKSLTLYEIVSGKILPAAFSERETHVFPEPIELAGGDGFTATFSMEFFAGRMGQVHRG